MLTNYYRLLLHKKKEVDPCKSKNNEVEFGGFRAKSKWTIIGIINGFPLYNQTKVHLVPLLWIHSTSMFCMATLIQNKQTISDVKGTYILKIRHFKKFKTV